MNNTSAKVPRISTQVAKFEARLKQSRQRRSTRSVAAPKVPSKKPVVLAKSAIGKPDFQEDRPRSNSSDMATFRPSPPRSRRFRRLYGWNQELCPKPTYA
ncbi:MAG: hypothetical protein A2542_01370 [Parcubacteria group bacterium RIFOXYD2_FULL_52_8]|nr:MAG: hypothetical protein A2542_01370 [Parcubacteria group bacterium RIFOXYD2_FULL_52_8]